jgi:hypothetical protein
MALSVIKVGGVMSGSFLVEDGYVVGYDRQVFALWQVKRGYWTAFIADGTGLE